MIFIIINCQPAKTIKSNYDLQGTVIFKESGKPFAQAYVYTVEGEEETLTNDKGEFKFTSWQKLPVTLHVDYPGRNFRLVVNDPTKKIRIEL
jgi:hypothetical protein